MICDRSVVFSRYSVFLHQLSSPPRYSWNIVESGAKHHKLTAKFVFRKKWYWQLPANCCLFLNFCKLFLSIYAVRHSQHYGKTIYYFYATRFTGYLFYLFDSCRVLQIQNEIKCKRIFNYSITMNMTNNYVNEHLSWETKGLNSMTKID